MSLSPREQAIANTVEVFAKTSSTAALYDAMLLSEERRLVLYAAAYRALAGVQVMMLEPHRRDAILADLEDVLVKAL